MENAIQLSMFGVTEVMLTYRSKIRLQRIKDELLPLTACLFANFTIHFFRSKKEPFKKVTKFNSWLKKISEIQIFRGILEYQSYDILSENRVRNLLKFQ